MQLNHRLISNIAVCSPVVGFLYKQSNQSHRLVGASWRWDRNHAYFLCFSWVQLKMGWYLAGSVWSALRLDRPLGFQMHLIWITFNVYLLEEFYICGTKNLDSHFSPSLRGIPAVLVLVLSIPSQFTKGNNLVPNSLGVNQKTTSSPKSGNEMLAQWIATLPQYAFSSCCFNIHGVVVVVTQPCHVHIVVTAWRSSEDRRPYTQFIRVKQSDVSRTGWSVVKVQYSY